MPLKTLLPQKTTTMKTKILLLSLFCLMFILESNAQKQWQHPIIKAYQNQSANVAYFTHQTDADYYVPLSVLNKKDNILYYFNTFGFAFDSVKIGPKLSQQLQTKTIDAFDIYAQLVTQEQLKEIEEVKNLLRDYGDDFAKHLPKETYINYLPLKKLPSLFERIILLDNYSKAVWQNHFLLNTIVEDRTDSQFLAKKNNYKNFKPAKQKIHIRDTIQDITYSNSNKFSTLSNAIINPSTSVISVFNRSNIWIDSFSVKKEKLKDLVSEKIDVFALYRNWLEYELQISKNLLEDLISDTSKIFASFSPQKKQTAYENLVTSYFYINKKILYATKPDKDLLLIDILEKTKSLARRTYSAEKGWQSIASPPPPPVDASTSYITRGEKEYFLTDHRGNVIASVSDRKIPVDSNNDGYIDYYVADVITATDYAPFGSFLPGRTYNNGSGFGGKKYGYNGKENDNEVKGDGNQQNYGMRIYDPRLGRFLSVDPLIKKYPELTPYQFASNTPIQAIDIDGLEAGVTHYNLTPHIKRIWDSIKSWWNSPASKGEKIVGQGNAERLGYSGYVPNTKGEAFMTYLATGLKDYNQYGTYYSTYGGMFGSLGRRTNVSESEVNVTPQQPQAKVGIDATQTKLKVGTYQDMKKTNAGTSLSADHIPSFAALKADAESQLGRRLTSAEAKTLREKSLTLVYETQIHQTTSRTYGGRNNKQQVQQDASNLYEAVKKDVDALKPALLKAGYGEQEINNASDKLLEPYKPKK